MSQAGGDAALPLPPSPAAAETAASRPEIPDSAQIPSLLAYPATYFLLFLNLAVYLGMVRFGPLPSLLHQTLLHAHPWQAVPFAATGSGSRTLFASLARLFTEPFPERVLLGFGAFSPDSVVLLGQWWRLVTSIFVHVTLLHLLLNMWCLWNLGLFGEPLLGKPGLVAVYLLTGAAGMLQSLLLSLFTGDVRVVVAGASGAIFGLAGILIVLLSNRRLAAPWEELRSLRLQVVFFAAANLLLGALPDLVPRLSPGLLRMFHVKHLGLPSIDNGAHFGGFLCGLALGLPLLPRMTSGRSSYRARQALVFSTAALLLLLVSYAVASFARGLVG